MSTVREFGARASSVTANASRLPPLVAARPPCSPVSRSLLATAPAEEGTAPPAERLARRTAGRTAVPGTCRREAVTVKGPQLEELYRALVDFTLRANASLVLRTCDNFYRSGKVVGCLPGVAPVERVRKKRKLCGLFSESVDDLAADGSPSAVSRRLCASVTNASYLVDPASSHMLVSKIKPCMSKYRPN